MDREKIFDAFRNCITEPKCKDCPWEQCEQFNQKKVSIPVTLALDVLNLLKEQPEIVRCKDCKHGQLIQGEIWCHKYVPRTMITQEWFCAYGERR